MTTIEEIARLMPPGHDLIVRWPTGHRREWQVEVRPRWDVSPGRICGISGPDLGVALEWVRDRLAVPLPARTGPIDAPLTAGAD